MWTAAIYSDLHTPNTIFDMVSESRLYQGRLLVKYYWFFLHVQRYHSIVNNQIYGRDSLFFAIDFWQNHLRGMSICSMKLLYQIHAPGITSNYRLQKSYAITYKQQTKQVYLSTSRHCQKSVIEPSYKATWEC